MYPPAHPQAIYLRDIFGKSGYVYSDLIALQMSDTEDVFSLEPIVGRTTQESCTFLCCCKVPLYNLVIIFYLAGEVVKDLTTEISLHRGVNRVVINGLMPDNLYRCEWRKVTLVDDFCCSENILFEFNVSTKSPSMICAVSCDNPDLDISSSLWKKIANISPDMCVHLGDNIYGDRVFRRCKSGKIPMVKCSEEYRKIYCKTWSPWGRLLRNTSHICIPDDHEVCDGYIGKAISSNKKDRDITDRGALVCSEFQMNMNKREEDDYAYMVPIDHDAVAIVISRVSFGGKTVDEAVIDRIEEFIMPYDKQIQRLLLFFSFPPLPIAHSRLHTCIFGKWPGGEDEILRFYGWCFSWLRSSANRKIMVVGGDIHMGVDCKIRHPRDNLEFHVYASGPITNQPTPAEYSQAKALMAMKTFGIYNVESKARCKRNFLIINPISMVAHHVYAKDYICPPLKLIKGVSKLAGII